MTKLDLISYVNKLGRVPNFNSWKFKMEIILMRNNQWRFVNRSITNSIPIDGVKHETFDQRKSRL
jgi:hypothetical protein